MSDINEKLIDVLMEVKSEIGNLSSRFNNIEGSVDDLKLALKELVKIEHKQQRLEDNYNRILDCCECLNDLKMKVKELEDRLTHLEKHQEVFAERGWKVFLGIIEKLIWWGLILIIAYKDKILP